MREICKYVISCAYLCNFFFRSQPFVIEFRRRNLTENEKLQIVGLHQAGKTPCEISILVGRARSTITRFLIRNGFPVQKKKRGPKNKINLRSARRLVRMDSGWGAQKYNLRWRKMRQRPYCKELHIQRRLEFARSDMKWEDKWKHVIFSNEKNFNLDGSDGLNTTGII